VTNFDPMLGELAKLLDWGRLADAAQVARTLADVITEASLAGADVAIDIEAARASRDLGPLGAAK
jgi:hypothetical protein